MDLLFTEVGRKELEVTCTGMSFIQERSGNCFIRGPFSPPTRLLGWGHLKTGGDRVFFFSLLGRIK